MVSRLRTFSPAFCDVAVGCLDAARFTNAGLVAGGAKRFACGRIADATMRTIDSCFAIVSDISDPQPAVRDRWGTLRDGDAGACTIWQSMDRGTDDPIDTVGCWRFDRKLATSRHEERGELVWDRPDGWHLISQPSLEQLGVGDSRRPVAKPGADLGAVAFPGPACRVVPVGIIELRAKLSSHSRDSLPIDLCWLFGKPSACPVKQEQHGKPEAVRTILRHNKRLICRSQRQRFGSVAVIRHCSDSMRGWRRETPKIRDKIRYARQSWFFHVAKICRESKLLRDDIRDRKVRPCRLVTLVSPLTIRTSRCNVPR